MYKPNGEEPMTKHEEKRRREAARKRLTMGSHVTATASEASDAEMFEALVQSSPRERVTDAGIAGLR